MNEYKRADLKSIFGMSAETIRQWSNEFSDYLSPLANPGAGRHRSFNDDDLSVLALVHEMRGDGFNFDEIHTALSSGQRSIVPEKTKMLALPMSEGRELVLVRQQIESLEDKLQASELELRNLREENITLKTRLEESEKRLELEREIGRLQAKIEMLQEDK